MNDGRYYSDIRQVMEVVGDFEATQCIRIGWELLAIKEVLKTEIHENKLVTNSNVTYVLGIRRGVKIITENQTSVPDLYSLHWEKSSIDPSGRLESVSPGNLPSEVKLFFEQNNRRYEDHEYLYLSTPSGWLNRVRREG